MNIIVKNQIWIVKSHGMMYNDMLCDLVFYRQ